MIGGAGSSFGLATFTVALVRDNAEPGHGVLGAPTGALVAAVAGQDRVQQLADRSDRSREASSLSDPRVAASTAALLGERAASVLATASRAARVSRARRSGQVAELGAAPTSTTLGRPIGAVARDRLHRP